MPEPPETIAFCHACGAPMDVSPVAPFSNVECPKCGKHTRVKREFGPYTLLRRHAVGGMSMVFAAQDNTLDREVALKILSEEFSADERRIAAFEQEARLTASLSHPNVVRVFTTGRAFGRFYIAMEFVPGGHFEHQIRERGKIPEREMLPLAIEVAQGLKAAHSAGLIHRDVKPGNILLDAEGHAKLVDFGLALVTQGGKAQAKELWATPYYVPPETVEGHAEDFRSDIYAFGASLYHALAGQPPCGEESMATDVLREAKKRIVPLGKTAPFVSAETCRIVDKAMAYQAAARFSSYDELIGALTAALAHLKSGKAESNGVAVKRRARKKQRELAAWLAIATMVAGGGAVALWRTNRAEPSPDAGLPPPRPVVEPGGSDTSQVIARGYREARSALDARNYQKAANEFTLLFKNDDVEEPSRTWAGVEAVLALFLDGHPAEARQRGLEIARHAASLPATNHSPAPELVATLNGLNGFAPLTVSASPQGGAPLVITAMLAGLKNWEQGMLEPAVAAFRVATATRLAPDERWASIYQTLANDHLADHGLLTGPLFSGLPETRTACDTAVAALHKLRDSLRTRGRARFNVQAREVDVLRHAGLLAKAGTGSQAGSPAQPDSDPVPDATQVLARLTEFSRHYQFTEATAYLKSLPADPKGMSRASAVAVTQAAAAFLADIEEDLARGPASLELALRTGETAVRVAVDATGVLSVTGANGVSRTCEWSDFSPDALIALHTMLVKNPKSEPDRVRRHECAIAFDWLAGNRERALRAASVLSQTDAGFKQRWDFILAGMPK